MTNNTTNSILGAITRQIEAEYGRPLAGIEAAVEKEGMVVEGFRLPSAGDKYLSSDLRAKHCTIAFVTDHRLILRPKPRRRIPDEDDPSLDAHLAAMSDVAPRIPPDLAKALKCWQAWFNQRYESYQTGGITYLRERELAAAIDAALARGEL